MPVNSAYRVNLFFTSSTFWEFVSARWIMNSNFKTVNYTVDWKEKTYLIKQVISRKCARKKSPYLKASLKSNSRKKVSLVKRINEGYVLFHLFLFLIFVQNKKSFQNISLAIF